MAAEKDRRAPLKNNRVSKRKTHPGFPGKKALDLVDVFLFLLDSRLPWTSRKLAEPYLSKKKRVHILTKPDLADPHATSLWLELFRERQEIAFAVDCRSGGGIEALVSFLKEAHSRVASARSGLENVRDLRLMLFGVPNVGKSSLANRLLGSQKAPYGAKPGLTRGSNWLKGKGFVTVLDTPGVLDTSAAKGDAKMKLAASWALSENAYDVQEVAQWLVSRALSVPDPARYISEYGKVRGFLGFGGAVEYERSCKALVQAFRNGDLGRLTLETPSDFEERQESEAVTKTPGKENVQKS